MQSMEETRNIGCFDNMIVDMLSNKKLNPKITELFIRGNKLNILLTLCFYYTILFLLRHKILD